MSERTDDALQSIQNIIAFGMPHKDDMYAVQGYCDMLADEIAAIEAERDEFASALHKYKNTIMPTLNEEIERLTKDRDAWKATACMMPEWMTEACQHCPLGYTKTRCQANDYSECKGIILAHFGAPEEGA